jgi:SAM-dependent methyltransferase
MLSILIQTITLLIIFCLLYLLSWFLPTDSPWAPWWTTSDGKSRKLCELVKLGKKDIFYELGSGTGTTLIVAAKEFGAKAVGIESSASRVFYSKFKVLTIEQLSNVTILKNDFFSVDLSPASVIYLYLVPRVIEKLKPKLLKELKPGTRVVSYVYKIDYLPLIKKDDAQQLYIYKIP